MRRNVRFVHSAALAALFAMGNTLIRYPWKAASMNVWIVFLFSAVCAVIPAFLLYPTFCCLFRGGLSRRLAKRSIAALAAILLGAYSLVCAYRAFSDYVAYAMEAVLPEGGEFILSVLLLFAALLLSRVSKRGIDVFALSCFVTALFCVLLLFSFGVRHYRWEYLSFSLPKDLSEAVKPIPTLLRESLLPLIPLSAYFALTVPQKGERTLALGTSLGYAVLLLCVLQTVLTFGAIYAAEPSYPYSYAVRVISIGPYFFRLEGFSYLTEYLTCLMRTAICLALSGKLLGRFFPRLGRWLPPIAALGMLLIFWIR